MSNNVEVRIDSSPEEKIYRDDDFGIVDLLEGLAKRRASTGIRDAITAHPATDSPAPIETESIQQSSSAY